MAEATLQAEVRISKRDLDLLLRTNKLALDYISRIGCLLPPQAELSGNVIIQMLHTALLGFEQPACAQIDDEDRAVCEVAQGGY